MIMTWTEVCRAIVKRGIQCDVNKVNKTVLFPLIFSTQLHSILAFAQCNTSEETVSDIYTHYVDRGHTPHEPHSSIHSTISACSGVSLNM